MVSLATGTRCVDWGGARDGAGALSDCHAEVVSRRALLRFLYSQLELLLGYEAPRQRPCLCSVCASPVDSMLSEGNQRRVRRSPSSPPSQAAATGCETASASTCTSARRRAGTLGSTARTRARLHVR